jgi:hypothetical protein
MHGHGTMIEREEKIDAANLANRPSPQIMEN